MAGGSLTVYVDTYEKASAVAARLLCWTSTVNDPKVTFINGVNALPFGVYVPEEYFGAGALILKRGGTDIVSGYVAGSAVVYVAGNGNGIDQDANLCPASTLQPTTTTATPVALNVGGVRTAITLNYANAGGAGVVNIFWGDGTSTLGAAESGASNHTYPDIGRWRIRVFDADTPTLVADFWIVIP